MASFNVELNSRANKDGLYSVFIRFTESRKSRKVKLNFRIPEEHFNKLAKYGKWVRMANSRHKSYNKQIEDAIDDLKAKYSALQKQDLPTLDHINKPLTNNAGVTVGEYFKEYLKNKEQEAAIGYYNLLTVKLNMFSDYIGEHVPMNEITTKHIAEYKAFLHLRLVKGSTINDSLRRVRTVFKIALNDDTVLKDPFRVNTPAKELQVSRVRLNDELIVKLTALQLGQEDNVRNYYLFSYYNAGIRIADFMQLRYQNIENGRLEYEMDKTGHKKSILLNKASLAILAKYIKPDAKPSDYIFPILQNTAEYAKFVTYEEKRKMPRSYRVELNRRVKLQARYINDDLNTISGLLKIPKAITFHTARHSYADKARRAMKTSSKITIVDIQKSLGHKKISTTQSYWDSFDKESLDEAMESIFE